MAGQTINDRLLAARHSLAGQGLAKSVCKATTEEMIGPKKKHLDCKLNEKKNHFPLTKRLIWKICYFRGPWGPFVLDVVVMLVAAFNVNAFHLSFCLPVYIYIYIPRCNIKTRSRNL